ncbi:hypothetical protein EDD15DRAFT_344529 [Pisolithus albus]|nr:hypothetical protein EDD15DRAFT_344529 [Pisolithus albus]
MRTYLGLYYTLCCLFCLLHCCLDSDDCSSICRIWTSGSHTLQSPASVHLHEGTIVRLGNMRNVEEWKHVLQPWPACDLDHRRSSVVQAVFILHCF